jgi:hypothetical protein
MFDVPDPLVVHMLLLSFMYDIICLPHLWYPQCDSPCMYVPKTHRGWFPLFDLFRSIGPGRCFIEFTGFIQCCHATNSVVPFSLSKAGFFVSATYGATTNTSHNVYNVLHTQPSSVCFENTCRNPCKFTGSGQLPIFFWNRMVDSNSNTLCGVMKANISLGDSGASNCWTRQLKDAFGGMQNGTI